MSVRQRTSATQVIDRQLLKGWALPTLAADADKEARGDVLVVGGSRELSGAVLLAGEAALRAGAGRVQLGVVRAVTLALGAAFPEARVIGLPEARRGELSRSALGSVKEQLEKCRALLLGPGMRDEAAVRPLLRAALEGNSSCRVVLDAAALRVLQGRSALGRGAPNRVIATPHAGEMAELWGCTRQRVRADPLKIARAAARELGVTLVLKGAQTLVVAPSGEAYRNVTGNSGLATCGSGDSLSGLIAGLAARGAEPTQAAVWGVYLHAAAGDALKRKRGPLGYLARELSAEVPLLLARLGKRPSR